ncbi:tetratricopeptide repeat protein [Schlesneria sp. DSM 10557]|uniref:tetratricopeptide repeat protein n=1 Tax=Schlesneria sp. DSM 10557 TaxID=3044399 RepID=UPI0035A06279
MSGREKSIEGVPTRGSKKSTGAEKKKRAGWERVLVWGGILTLLVLVLIEGTSSKFYGETLKSFESRFRIPDGGRERPTVPLAEATGHIRGFPFKRELGTRPNRRIVYSWPSFFRTFKMVMNVNDKNEVVSVDSHGSIDDLPVPASNAAAEIEAKFYLKGKRVKTGENVIELAPPESPDGNQFVSYYGSLARELVRQSVLMAARCEMGLRTRDSNFGEVLLFEAGEPRFPLQVSSKIDHRNQQQGPLCVIEVSRTQPDGKHFQWTKAIPFNGADLEDFVSQLEALSRGDFIQALQDAGFSLRTRAIVDSSSSSTVASKRPSGRPKLDAISQFAELRRVSAEFAANGESDAVLEGLIEAYSNLGSLTDHYWSSMPKSFKARALLFAQRYVARRGSTPATLAFRAYARALAGRHVTALADVQAARSIEGGTAPAWLNLIEAYCAYKPDVLQKTKGDDKELSLYLLMRISQRIGSKKQATSTITRFLEVNPASFKALLLLCETYELGNYRAVTEAGFDVTWSSTYPKLQAISDLPPAALQIATTQSASQQFDPDNEYRSRIAFIDALRAAGGDLNDESEPSWSMLAEMLEETTFTQVVHTLYCEDVMLGISAEKSLERLRPLVESHRWKGFLDAFTDDKKFGAAQMSHFAREFKPGNYEHSMLLMLDVLSRTAPRDDYAQFFPKTLLNFDFVYEDLVKEIRYQSAPPTSIAQCLRSVSPHQPATAAVLIEHDWENAKLLAPEWEVTYAKCPNVMIKLAEKFETLRKMEDAVRCFKKSIDLEPTYAAYRKLADVYYWQGNLTAYQETLEDSLALPDFGLERSNTEGNLATFLMRKGDWEGAQPYAESAAGSYSSTGLLTAAHCAEGLKDWPRAEAYTRAASERYRGSEADWYIWCVRTGHGDVRAARALADQYWQSFVPPLSQAQSDSLLDRYLMDGKLTQALEIVRQFEIEPISRMDTVDLNLDPRKVLHGALIADELNEFALRDKLLKAVPQATISRGSDQLIEFANLMLRALKEPDKVQWDGTAFDEIMARATRDEVTFLYFAAGKTLWNRKQIELGRPYLEAAATSFSLGKRSCMFAAQMLRSQNLPVGHTRLSELPDDLEAVCSKLQNVGNQVLLRNYEEAERYLKEAEELRPGFSAIHNAKAHLATSRGRFSEAVQHFEEAVKLNPDSAYAHSQAAWILATCPDDAVRNGAAAVEHAEAALRLRPITNYLTHTCLAAAYAEVGRFDEAYRQETMAIDLSDYSSKNHDRLMQYNRKKPFRDQSLLAEPLHSEGAAAQE